MLSDRNPHWVYTQTIKMFAAPASPPFEDEAELERHWGRVRGIDNDVGQIRSILVHRPGPEMAVVRAQNSCPFCGVRLAEGQEPFVCADGTKDVSCAPCHLVRHLERNTIAEEAVLIWLPEMTQAALNKLATAAHRRLADAAVLYRAANLLTGLHQDVASGAIEALRAVEKRSIEAEARLGTSSPRLLAAALLRAKPKFYEDRARLLGGLRLLCRARFFVDGEDIYPRLIAAPGAP